MTHLNPEKTYLCPIEGIRRKVSSLIWNLK